jgi:hypothetical protein
MKFKYTVGEKVYNIQEEEVDIVYQKMVIHGEPYYRLRYHPTPVHEEKLRGLADCKFTHVVGPAGRYSPLLKLQYGKAEV